MASAARSSRAVHWSPDTGAGLRVAARDTVDDRAMRATNLSGVSQSSASLGLVVIIVVLVAQRAI